MNKLILGLLAFAMLIGMVMGAGSTTWLANQKYIDIGGLQTLIANASGGVSPYTYNFLIYNPSNVLTYQGISTPGNFIGDVLTINSNGLIKIYTAKSNTNIGRGQALLNAFSSQNITTNEKIYLKAETYNVLNSSLVEADGDSFYGAGKFKTTIFFNPLQGTLEPNFNTITADMDITTVFGQTAYETWGNTIARNIFVNSTIDDDGIIIGPSGSLSNQTMNLYNITVLSYFDDFALDNSAPGPTSIVNIYDSNLIAAPPSGGIGRGISLRGAGDLFIANVVNTIINVNGILGGTEIADVRIDSGNAIANIFGGNLIVSNAIGSATPAYSLYNEVAGLTNAISTNSNVVFNSAETFGTIGFNTLGAAPIKSYSKAPLLINVLQFLQIGPSGVWIANTVVKDSGVNTITNTLSYTVNNALLVTISPPNPVYVFPSNTQVIENAIWSGGTPNYILNWTILKQSPTLIGYNGFNNSAQSHNTLFANAVTTPNGNEWFCAGATNGIKPISNFGGATSTYSTYFDPNRYSGVASGNVQGCNTSGAAATLVNRALVSIVVNYTSIPTSPSPFSTFVANYPTQGSGSLTYTVSNSPNLVILMIGCGADNCDPTKGMGGSISVPSGCNLGNMEDNDLRETAASYTCINQLPGTYTITASQSAADASYALGAFVYQNSNGLIVGSKVFNSITTGLHDTSNQLAPTLPFGTYWFDANVSDSTTVNTLVAFFSNAAVVFTITNALSSSAGSNPNFTRSAGGIVNGAGTGSNLFYYILFVTVILAVISGVVIKVKRDNE